MGWTSQPFTAAILTQLIRGGSGSVPDRRRHALRGSGLLCLIHVALFSSNPRRSWFTSQSNKALATAPFASKVISRRPKPGFAINTTGGDS